MRELGVKDPAVSPTHAWRHTFKQRAARNGIAENVHDEITGHAPASEGRKYTVPTVEDMAAALKKFPRYHVVAGPNGHNWDQEGQTWTGYPFATRPHQNGLKIGVSENGLGRPGYHSNFS